MTNRSSKNRAKDESPARAICNHKKKHYTNERQCSSSSFSECRKVYSLAQLIIYNTLYTPDTTLSRHAGRGVREGNKNTHKFKIPRCCRRGSRTEFFLANAIINYNKIKDENNCGLRGRLWATI